MDPWAFLAANRLVGNADGAPALEMTLFGGTFVAEGPLTVALCGAPMGPTRDASPVPMWQSFRLETGQTLKLGAASEGARTYMAVAGGFQVPAVMKSASTFLKGGFGGLEGRAIQAGDTLAVAPVVQPDLSMWPDTSVPTYGGSPILRVVWGPEAGVFTPKTREAFLNSPYQVTPSADRMGYRLAGPAVAPTGGAGIASDPVPMGTVQVAGDGQPVLLMADRQPTGGYTRLAVVISADLPAAGQLRPGQTVGFALVTLAQADEAWAQQRSGERGLR
jgi:antagonist of KipI